MIYESRTKSVYPGETCYFWFTKPTGIEKPFVVPDGWEVFHPSAIGDGDSWYWQWAIAVKVPEDALFGKYPMRYTDGGEIISSIIVNPKPKTRQTARITAGTHQSRIQSLLYDGYDLEFLPGLYELVSPVYVPDDAVIKSAGAKIIRKTNSKLDAVGNKMFVPLGSMTLYGLNLETTGENFYIHADPVSTGNITIRDCTFKYGNLWQASRSDMLVEDCKFYKAGTGWVTPNSVYINNEFYGPTKKGQHSFFIVHNNVLVVGNRFYGTNRGIVLQTGDVSGCLVLDNYFSGVRGGEGNAGEIVLLEGQNGMHDNAFVDIRADNCSGPGLNVWGGKHHDNIFWNFFMDVDSVGINIAGVDGGKIGPNDYYNIQTTGGMTLIGPQDRQRFWNIQLIESPTKCGNQGPFTNVYLDNKKPIDRRLGAEKADHQFIGCGYVKNDKYEPIS